MPRMQLTLTDRLTLLGRVDSRFSAFLGEFEGSRATNDSGWPSTRSPTPQIPWKTTEIDCPHDLVYYSRSADPEVRHRLNILSLLDVGHVQSPIF